MNDKKYEVRIVENYEVAIDRVELDNGPSLETTPLVSILRSVAEASVELARTEESHEVFWLEAAEHADGWEEIGWVDDSAEATLLPRVAAERLAEDSTFEQFEDDSTSDFYYGFIRWRHHRTCRANVEEV